MWLKAWVTEWTNVPVCKTGVVRLRRFESSPMHNMENEKIIMKNQNHHLEEKEPGITFSPESLAWLTFIEKISVLPPSNIEVIAKTAEVSRQLGCGIPIIVNLCPMIKNLEQPTPGEQTREFIPLSEDNPRFVKFIEELSIFMVTTKDLLGIAPEIFLIFSDVWNQAQMKCLLTIKK